jgi:hypothetical protein
MMAWCWRPAAARESVAPSGPEYRHVRYEIDDPRTVQEWIGAVAWWTQGKVGAERAGYG